MSEYQSRKLSAKYPTDLPAWKDLKSHYRSRMATVQLRQLFARDKKRSRRCSVTSGDLYLDYSKNHLTTETQRLLTSLARQANVPDAIEAMFSGLHINVTENRSVLHSALRATPRDRVGKGIEGVRVCKS